MVVHIEWYSIADCIRLRLYTPIVVAFAALNVEVVGFAAQAIGCLPVTAAMYIIVADPERAAAEKLVSTLAAD
jgi:hypothetical protein